eukprot:4877177-Pyramimonas_sp.AAC.1
MTVQAARTSRSPLPDQGNICVLCLASHASLPGYGNVALGTSEGSCVLSRVLSSQVRLHASVSVVS